MDIADQGDSFHRVASDIIAKARNIERFALNDWQVMLGYLPKHGTDIQLVAPTGRRESHRFQGQVVGYVEVIILVIVPLNELMKQQVRNPNNMGIVVVYINTKLFAENCYLVQRYRE